MDTVSHQTVPEYLAFGDIGMDVAVRVAHMPQPDEKLKADILGEYPGGMAANTASTVAALGGYAGVVSMIGADKFGRDSLADLQKRAVDVRFVRMIDASTFWTLALLAEDGEKSLVEFHSPAGKTNWDGFDYSILKHTICIHAIPGESDKIVNLFQKARRFNVMTSLDVEPAAVNNPDLPTMLGLTDMVFINAPAALKIAPDFIQAVRQMRAMGATTIVVTRGAKGCLLLDRSAELHEIAGHKVATVDTTGAGDCFAGAFAFCRMHGWSDFESTELANLMAAISTTALGSRGALLSTPELSKIARQKGFAWWKRLLMID